MLLFEDLEPKLNCNEQLTNEPTQRAPRAIDSRVLCQTSAPFQEQEQLLQVLWLKVALC